jgi:hypothetical protein
MPPFLAVDHVAFVAMVFAIFAVIAFQTIR